MQAIEFQSTVKNGLIEIPHQYIKNLTTVRVILLVEEPLPPTMNFIDQLLSQPIRVQDFRPLSREMIYAR